MNNMKYLNRAKLLNPLVVLLYGVACYYLADLMQYGGVSRRVPIILFAGALLLLWFGYSFYKSRTQPAAGIIYPDSSKIETQATVSKWWFYTALVLLISLTGWTGYRIYQSAIPYNGKLSWYIEDYFNQKEVPFEENNIYTDGLDGMLTAIEEEVTLPEELYVSDPFTLTFTDSGEISDLYGFLYGMDQENETESFLISYDADQSDKLQVHLDGYVEVTYDEAKRFEPLVEGLTVVDLPRQVFLMKSEEITLEYEGFHTTTSMHDVFHYYDEEGEFNFDNFGLDEHVGYTFTLESPSRSRHFIAYDEEAIQEHQRQLQEQAELEADPNYVADEQITEQHFPTEKIGYQLVELDAMTGSRFYGLRRSSDGGASWTMHNPDPFMGSTGVSAGLSFVDEQLGFAALSRNGGSEATLFRTTDGGLSFERMEFPALTVEQNGVDIQPFDFPEMPYLENGQLILPVGQGSDGDYQRGAKALFVSDDEGATFEFRNIEE